MKFWAPILVLAAALAGGCQTQQKPQTSASVLDVSGPAPKNNYSQSNAGYQPSGAYQPAGAYGTSPNPASTSTPPYMLPSAYPPPEPAPAMTVVEAQPPTAVPASATARATPHRAKPALASDSGSQYTVKQGDTLYHIAKVRYGDGKQWERIASANPGVSATSLKVGQVLVIP